MKRLISSILILSSGLVANTFNVSNTSELRQALYDAAQNGEDDIINLSSGIYRINDDSKGTFRFLDNENYSLTLVGSSREEVILDGENSGQILNIKSSLPITLKVKHITFANANTSLDGAGIQVGGFDQPNHTIEVDDCNFSHNIVFQNDYHNSGGGFWSANASVKNSIFEYNEAGGGAGFYVGYDSSNGLAVLENCKFIGNKAYGGYYDQSKNGGGFYAETGGNTITIKNSLFENNSAYDGGGFYLNGSALVQNCAFKSNSAHDGGGFKISFLAIVQDNSFSNNSATEFGGGFYMGMDWLKIPLLLTTKL